MAEIFREVVVPPQPERKRRELTGHVCDLCGASGRVGAWGDVRWDGQEEDDGNVAETEVLWVTGYAYPDGGHVTKRRVDICLNCMTGIVLPFLAERGVKPRTEDCDF